MKPKLQKMTEQIEQVLVPIEVQILRNGLPPPRKLIRTRRITKTKILVFPKLLTLLQLLLTIIEV